MTVLRVDRAFERTGVVNAAGRDVERVFIVRSDGNDTESSIMDHFLLTNYPLGVSLAEYPTARLTDIRPRNLGDTGRAWEVSLIYSTNWDADDPLSEPPEITLGFQQFTRRIERDRDDKPIQNSAGEPFDEPPEIDDSRPVLSITRNRLASQWDAAQAIEYKDAINSDSFWGAEPKQAKMANIGGTRFQKNGIWYVRENYEIHFRRDYWNLKILDAGYRIRPGGNFDPKSGKWNRHVPTVRIVGADGEPVDKPQLLDGNGQLLGKNQDGSEKSPVYLEFDVFDEKPFSALNLPLP